MNLTPQVRKLLEQAEEEARRLGHPYVGTEHVLLALLSDAGGHAGKALRGAASEEAIRRRLDELRFPPARPDLPGHPLPWRSCFVRDASGTPTMHGKWMKQYYVDRDGRPVRNSAGKLVHTELGDHGRPVLDPEGVPRLIEVPIRPGEVGQDGLPL